MAEQDRFQHISGKVEHAERGSERHTELMQSEDWQKAPLSTVSGEELAAGEQSIAPDAPQGKRPKKGKGE